MSDTHSPMRDDMISAVAPQESKMKLMPETFWFIGTTFMTGFSIAMWYWYPNWIRRNNNIKWRSNTYGTYLAETAEYDKEWAWDTEEMKAWNTAAWMQFSLFAPAWALWLLNWNLDNEGGSLHKAFYWHAKLLVLIAPFAIMFNGARLYIVHH